MKRIHILVEGQTEETFVRDVLQPHLVLRQVYILPVIISTKRIKSGGKFRGGITNYSQVRKEALRLLGDSSVAAVTTMIDYYGLPPDFPGYSSLPAGICYQRVEHLQRAFVKDLDHSRFIPFITLHEFEALLFTDVGAFAAVFPGQVVVDPLRQVREQFNSPEEINQGEATHPAARIRQYVRGYRKPLHGSRIAQQIGLAAVRRECPHFDQWISLLESLD